MSEQRPAIKVSEQAHGHVAPPQSARRSFVLDRDETTGLVALLRRSQQALEGASRYIDDARDANDEELARFLEQTLHQDLERVAQAKRLLAIRLQHDVEAARPLDSNSPHGRVHYVSTPDAPISDLNATE